MSGSGRVSIYIYIHVGLVEGFEEERGTKRLRGSREVNGERGPSKRAKEGKRSGAEWVVAGCGGDRIGGAKRGFGRGLIKPS